MSIPRSARSTGTRFRLYFPAVESAAVQSAQAEADLPTGHGELILVVDDEASIREMTGTILEASGYQVVTAADGPAATGIFADRKDEIAAIIIDHMMPFMDGTMAIRAMQQIRPQLRALMMSGMSEKAATLEGTGIPFLSKPFTRRDLLTSLKNLLTRQ